MAHRSTALRWLRSHGAQQIYFKYCSTFDSTPEGNIGPVTEALLDAMARVKRRGFTIATPAFPDNQRTVFKGLSVRGRRAAAGKRHAESSAHADDGFQSRPGPASAMHAGRSASSTTGSSRKGADAIRGRIDELRRRGVGIAIVDAISNDDLISLGPRSSGLPLVTAGSGSRSALPANFGLAPSDAACDLPRASGGRAIVSGSCSTGDATAGPGLHRKRGASYRIDPLQVAAGVDVVTQALSWARSATGPTLRADLFDRAAADVKAAQAAPRRAAGRDDGRESAGGHRPGVVERGVRQLVIAGGETAGARVQALGGCAAAHRPRRSTPACRGATRSRAARPRWPSSRAEVRQLRRRRFFHQGFRGVGMNESQAREEICRIGQKPVRARLRSRHRRQHQRPPLGRRRLPDHAHRCVPRFPRTARLARLDAERRQLGGDRASKIDGAARGDLRGGDALRSCDALRHPHTQHALRGIDAEAARRGDCCPPSRLTS